MAPKKKAAIGFDLGGSHFAVAGVDENLELVGAIERIPIDPQDPTEKILTAIAEGITLKAVELEQEGFDVVGCGGGAPGPANFDTGTIGQTPNIPGLRDCCLTDEIENRTGLTARINNDANLIVLGETLAGAGKGHVVVYGQTIGTGYGHGLVIDGKIFTGAGFMAMELARVPVAVNCPTTIEDVVSSRGISEEYFRQTGMELTPKEIQNLAQNDEQALYAYKKLGQYIGFTLAWIQGTVSPDIMLVGGNIAKAWPLFQDTMMETLNQHSWKKDPLVTPMVLGEKAGIIGGASLFLR